MGSAVASRKGINYYSTNYFCPFRRGSPYYDLKAIGTKSVALEAVLVGCDTVFKKNVNAAKPPEQSKGLGGIITMAERTKTLHGIKRDPQRVVRLIELIEL